MSAHHIGRALDRPVKFWAQESWSWKAGIWELRFIFYWSCARKFAFLENLWYNKSGILSSGRTKSLECKPKFDREVKAGRLGRNLKKSKIYGIINIRWGEENVAGSPKRTTPCARTPSNFIMSREY